jgi:hypothetical protein
LGRGRVGQGGVGLAGLGSGGVEWAQGPLSGVDGMGRRGGMPWWKVSGFELNGLCSFRVKIERIL